MTTFSRVYTFRKSPGASQAVSGGCTVNLYVHSSSHYRPFVRGGGGREVGMLMRRLWTIIWKILPNQIRHSPSVLIPLNRLTVFRRDLDLIRVHFYKSPLPDGKCLLLPHAFQDGAGEQLEAAHVYGGLEAVPPLNRNSYRIDIYS